MLFWLWYSPLTRSILCILLGGSHHFRSVSSAVLWILPQVLHMWIEVKKTSLFSTTAPVNNVFLFSSKINVSWFQVFWKRFYEKTKRYRCVELIRIRPGPDRIALDADPDLDPSKSCGSDSVSGSKTLVLCRPFWRPGQFYLHFFSDRCVRYPGWMWWLTRPSRRTRCTCPPWRTACAWSRSSSSTSGSTPAGSPSAPTSALSHPVGFLSSSRAQCKKKFWSTKISLVTRKYRNPFTKKHFFILFIPLLTLHSSSLL
jgi:hypothetical protein